MNWLLESNRWKHLVFAIGLGLFSKSWYCTEYAALGTSSALEYKDTLYGNKWDWLDWLCTIVGFNIGYLCRYLIYN